MLQLLISWLLLGHICLCSHALFYECGSVPVNWVFRILHPGLLALPHSPLCLDLVLPPSNLLLCRWLCLWLLKAQSIDWSGWCYCSPSFHSHGRWFFQSIRLDWQQPIPINLTCPLHRLLLLKHIPSHDHAKSSPNARSSQFVLNYSNLADLVFHQWMFPSFESDELSRTKQQVPRSQSLRWVNGIRVNCSATSICVVLVWTATPSLHKRCDNQANSSHFTRYSLCFEMAYNYVHVLTVFADRVVAHFSLCDDAQ